MRPCGPNPEGCDIDASIGIAPTGFSKESRHAALVAIEHKSKTLKTLHYYAIVFGVAYDIIAIHPNTLCGFPQFVVIV